jgi:hypothetical protein
MVVLAGALAYLHTANQHSEVHIGQLSSWLLHGHACLLTSCFSTLAVFRHLIVGCFLSTRGGWLVVNVVRTRTIIPIGSLFVVFLLCWIFLLHIFFFFFFFF